MRQKKINTWLYQWKQVLSCPHQKRIRVAHLLPGNCLEPRDDGIPRKEDHLVDVVALLASVEEI